MLSRDREVVSRQAHNLKIVGANPTPATKQKQFRKELVFCFGDGGFAVGRGRETIVSRVGKQRAKQALETMGF